VFSDIKIDQTFLYCMFLDIYYFYVPKYTQYAVTYTNCMYIYMKHKISCSCFKTENFIIKMCLYS